MLISDPCVVSLTWKLTDGQNRPIDELAQPVEFFFGGDDLLTKVEEALNGHYPRALPRERFDQSSQAHGFANRPQPDPPATASDALGK